MAKRNNLPSKATLMQATRLYTVLLASLFFFSATADSIEAQTITHVPLYTFHGESAGARFGESVSGAGDVNGDGTPDLIIGAAGTSRARVLSGSDGSVLYDFNGNGCFGRSVSGAGDVNGDGRDDMIISEPTNQNTGSAQVLSGSDGSLLYSFHGDNEGDNFGGSVSGAGDVNGDGRADLIVGASGDDNNVRNGGSARILSGIDGSILFTFYGEFSERLGFSVSSAGDVNGDGRADVIVGTDIVGEYARVLSGANGSVLYTFSGDRNGDAFGRSVSGAGDVNGDGFDDLIVGATNFGASRVTGYARVLSGSDGSVLHNFNGDVPLDLFGYSVSGAGDVNGDGRADLIVGATEDATTTTSSGSARVLSGSDGSVLYNFYGDERNDRFGWSVSGVGDVNGDGIDDFIVGASSGGANRGGYARVFVSQISPLLLGDCNQDGDVNFLDIAPFISILSAGDFLAEADVNEDEEVDFLDISPFIAILSSQ